jgi:hypothetical protein
VVVRYLNLHNNLGLLCFIIYTPLCYVRKIEKFSSTHILADIIILITAITVVIYTIVYAAANGAGP